MELEAFEEAWGEKFPSIGKSWRNNWDNLITLFDYPEDIRKAIYTTNAIESLNSVIRKAIKNRKIFRTDESVMKVIYLGKSFREMDHADQELESRHEPV